MDIRVEAIRNDALVGRGTCASVDECYSDEDLIAELNEHNITTPRAAVEWARDGEEIWLERGLNQRWGSDYDEYLLMYNEWKENVDKNPIAC